MNTNPDSSPSSESDEETKVLIILTGALGDVARGLFLPAALKSSRCHLTWLVDSRWADLVRLNSQVDLVLPWDRKSGMKGVGELLRSLRKNHFDVTLDLQRTLRSGFLSYMSGAPRRIGFHRRNCKEPNWIFQTETIEFLPENENKFLNYQLFLKSLGIALPGKPDFGLEDTLSSRQHVGQIGVVLGASRPSKLWPLEGYSKLLKIILEESTSEILLLGDGSQGETAQKLLDHFDHERLRSSVGKTTLRELVEAIAQCEIVVGPDTGPGHIAAALNVPYVSLFGPTDPDRVAPYGQRDLVVTAQLGCRPCARRSCPGLNSLCMRLIDPRWVWERVREYRMNGQ